MSDRIRAAEARTTSNRATPPALLGADHRDDHRVPGGLVGGLLLRQTNAERLVPVAACKQGRVSRDGGPPRRRSVAQLVLSALIAELALFRQRPVPVITT